MPRVMKWIAALSTALTLLIVLLPMNAPAWVGIMSGTIAYHFCMRLAVGACYDLLMGNRVDYRRAWFRQKAFEPGLYRALGVQRWKAHMPTYAPELFDPKQHSWDEIAQAMCQSELVHETIALLSFLPLAAVRWFGALPVFLITSVLPALFDLSFAAIQRYNRPTVIRIADREKRRSARKG